MSIYLSNSFCYVSAGFAFLSLYFFYLSKDFSMETVNSRPLRLLSASFIVLSALLVTFIFLSIIVNSNVVTYNLDPLNKKTRLKVLLLTVTHKV